MLFAIFNSLELSYSSVEIFDGSLFAAARPVGLV